MGAKNKVLSGAYQGHFVNPGSFGGSPYCNGPWGADTHYINKSTVEMYELITEEKVKSASSAILRGAAGAALLGPVGLLAGLSAKNKGINTVAIMWSDGQKSLMEVDDKVYKSIVKAMF